MLIYSHGGSDGVGEAGDVDRSAQELQEGHLTIHHAKKKLKFAVGPAVSTSGIYYLVPGLLSDEEQSLASRLI